MYKLYSLCCLYLYEIRRPRFCDKTVLSICQLNRYHLCLATGRRYHALYGLWILPSRETGIAIDQWAIIISIISTEDQQTTGRCERQLLRTCSFSLLFLLERSLAAMAAPVTRAEVLKIYKTMLRESSKFSFYNYR